MKKKTIDGTGDSRIDSVQLRRSQSSDSTVALAILIGETGFVEVSSEGNSRQGIELNGVELKEMHWSIKENRSETDRRNGNTTLVFKRVHSQRNKKTKIHERNRQSQSDVRGLIQYVCWKFLSRKVILNRVKSNPSTELNIHWLIEKAALRFAWIQWNNTAPSPAPEFKSILIKGIIDLITVRKRNRIRSWNPTLEILRIEAISTSKTRDK